MPQLRRVLVAVLIGTASAALAFVLATSPLFQRVFGQLEGETLDVRTQYAAELQIDSTLGNPHAMRTEVALLLFDSTSVQDWPYLSPFPRAVLADLIDAVAAAGPRAIGLDVLLPRRFPELDAMDGGDQRLRDAIARAGNVVLVMGTEGTADARTPFEPPDAFFAEAAAAVATADLVTEFETVRETVLTVRTADGRLVPGFALALFALARGLDVDSLLAEADRSGSLDLPGLPPELARVPDFEAVQEMPVLFVGPPSRPGLQDGAFPAYSSGDVRMLGAFGGVPAEWFRDKVVLIGTGYHFEDRFRTPFYKATTPTGDDYGWMYGVEVHANAVDNLLSGTHPRRPGEARVFALLMALGLLAAAATFLRGVAWGAAAASTLLAATTVAAWMCFDPAAIELLGLRLFDVGYVELPVIAPTLALAFAFLGSTTYTSLVEGREKRVLRGAFSKYVSPVVVDQLVADPSRVKLGGEKRTISILFSDLAGFTSLSETMEPERLLQILNDYLDEMADIVLDEGGTLDKYIGDAVMAFWGAPTPVPDHSLRACRTALRMQRRLSELNQEWKPLGLPSLKMRIGLNTGTPVVGNIGGEKRFDYTALGDAVNLAARLEPACKSYGVSIMLAQPAREGAGDAIVVRELELLAVYGKSEPVTVYELVAMAGDDLGDAAEVLDLYARGLAAFRNRDFELGASYFQAALEVDPGDGPSALYLERCREFLAAPPPADWDFVERRQVK